MHAKKSLSEKINNEKITGLLCVSPFIFGFFLFLLVPMAISLYYAFCEYNILSSQIYWTCQFQANVNR